MKMTTLKPEYSSPELSVCRVSVSSETCFAASEGIDGVSAAKIYYDESTDRMDI